MTDTEANLSRSLKFPFAFIVTGTVVALWCWLFNSEWKVLTRTHPLLRNLRNRALITPVSPLRTRLIHTSQSYWPIYRSFEIILKCDFVHWFGSQIHCLKKIQSDTNYIFINPWLQRAARALTVEPAWSSAYQSGRGSGVDSEEFCVFLSHPQSLFDFCSSRSLRGHFLGKNMGKCRLDRCQPESIPKCEKFPEQDSEILEQERRRTK